MRIGRFLIGFLRFWLIVLFCSRSLVRRRLLIRVRLRRIRLLHVALPPPPARPHCRPQPASLGGLPQGGGGF